MPNYYPDLYPPKKDTHYSGKCLANILRDSCQHKKSEIKPSLFRVSPKLQVVMLNQRHSFLKGCVNFKSKYVIMLWESRSLIFWKWDKSENYSYPRMSKVLRNTKYNHMDIWRHFSTYKRVFTTVIERWIFKGTVSQDKKKIQEHLRGTKNE